MWEEERKSDSVNPSLNTAVRTYTDLLLSIQEMKFDLGLDEYKRGVPVLKATEPDPDMQKRVFEAYAAAEEVFKRLGCGPVIDVDNDVDRPSVHVQDTKIKWLKDS